MFSRTTTTTTTPFQQQQQQHQQFQQPMYSQFPLNKYPPIITTLMRGGPLPPIYKVKGSHLRHHQDLSTNNRQKSESESKSRPKLESKFDQQQQQQRLSRNIPTWLYAWSTNRIYSMPPHFPSNNSNNNLLIIPLDLVHHLHLWYAITTTFSKTRSCCSKSTK